MKLKIIIRIIIYSLLILILIYKLKDFFFTNSEYSKVNPNLLKTKMIRIINNERESNNISSVEYDSITAVSAQFHADEMKKYNYFSHYSINGIPPYIRYSLKSNGAFAIGENIALGANYKILKIGFIELKGKIDIKNIIRKLNYDMYSEKPPNDGHRKTILNKHYNRIGIGIAYNDTLLFYVETFTGKYIELLNDIPQNIKAGNSINIYAQILYDSLELEHIKVYYDNIPDSLPLGNDFFIDPRNSYGYPDSVIYYLTAQLQINGNPNFYNTIQIYDDQFYGNIYTFNRGVYTIVPILSDGRDLFEGANISILAE